MKLKLSISVSKENTHLSSQHVSIMLNIGTSYLVHSKSVAAGADEGDEPEGKRVSVGDKHLDEIKPTHQVYSETSQDTCCLQELSLN